MTYKPDPDLDAKIAVLYLTGHSQRDIARRLQVTKAQVESALARTNTPGRSISDAVRLKGAM